MDLITLRSLFAYNDRANRLVFSRAAALDTEKLDQPLDIGLGSLRRILIHTYNGEATWLARQEGNVEAKWPPEDVAHSPADVMAMLEKVFVRRDQFLAGLNESRLNSMQTYRDSRGSLFQATLRDMLLQGIVHSIHHRAQAVNAIRRLGGEPPEVDYMVSVRQAV